MREAVIWNGLVPALLGAKIRQVPFKAICDDPADRIGALRAVVPGAGHEIQFTGPAVNEVPLRLWRAADSADKHDRRSH